MSEKPPQKPLINNTYALNTCTSKQEFCSTVYVSLSLTHYQSLLPLLSNDAADANRCQ